MKPEVSILFTETDLKLLMSALDCRGWSMNESSIVAVLREKIRKPYVDNFHKE